MESKTSYTMVGLAVLFLSSALLSTLLWLSVGFDQKKYHPYVVYMQESSSLSEDSPVKYNGVKVGTIQQIELSKTNPQMVKLILMIQEGTLITTSTRATLIMQGITGNSFLGLSATTASLTPLKKIGNNPYPVIPYVRSFFGQLEVNVTDITHNLKRFFDDENASNIKKTLTNLEKISSALGGNSNNLEQTLTEFPKAIAEFKAMVLAIKNVTKDIAKASSQVTKTMQTGKDSIDQITEQALPPATLLLQRLDSVAADLQQVSAMLKQDPSVIIHGTSPEKPGPGE